MSYRLGGRNPLAYQGVEPLQPPDLVVIPRNPVSGTVPVGGIAPDWRNFNIGTFWVNTVNTTCWVLVQKSNGNPLWIMVGVASTGNINTLTAEDGVVMPTANNINIFGDGVNINTTHLFSTLNVNLNPNILVSSVTTTTLTVLGNAIFDGSIQNTTFGAGVVQTNGAGVFSSTKGTDGQVLISSTAGVPVWNTLTAGAGITITNASNSITVAVTGAIPGTINNIQGNDNLSITGTIVHIVTANSTAKLLRTNATTDTLDFGLTTNLVLGSDPSGTIAGSNDNTGLGNGALASLTNGDANVAVGVDALALADDGSNNIAIGVGALNQLSDADDNIAIGRNAMSGAVSGVCEQNVVIGNGSGIAMIAASDNVILGYSAGTSLTGGDNNIIIGPLAGTTYTTTSSNICIGNIGNIADSGFIRIGTNGTHVAAIVQGIYPVTVASPRLVTVDVNGQLGSTPVSAATGALVLIQTQTAAGSGVLNFTTGITATYNDYLITFSNGTIEAASNQWLNVQFSTDGGGTYITSAYITDTALNTTGFDLAVTLGPSAVTQVSGAYYLHNLTLGSGFLSFDGESMHHSVGATTVSPRNFAGIYLTPITVNALRVVMSDGSTFSGRFSLYGLVS